MSETFNGWSNRETWAANLWLENTEMMYRQINSMLKRDYEASIQKTYLNYQLANSLRDYVDELFEQWLEIDGSVARTMSAAAQEMWKSVRLMHDDIGSLWRVDWVEIVENWLAENTEAGETE